MNCKYYSYQDYDNIIAKFILRRECFAAHVYIKSDGSTKLVVEDARRFKLLRLLNFLVKFLCGARFFKTRDKRILVLKTNNTLLTQIIKREMEGRN